MKKLSKIVALLLAGALTMLLFTACGGGGGAGKIEEDKQKDMMNNIMSSSQGKKIKENDPGLYQTALSDLNADIEAHSKNGGGAFKGEVRVRGTDPAEEFVTITVTADYKVGQFLTNLLDFISRNIGIKYPGTNVDFRANSSWSKAAVVVKSDQYGTYVAVAIQVKNLNYPKPL